MSFGTDFTANSFGSVDDTLERLVAMTNQTNLVALDKTIAAIKRSPLTTYAAAAARCGSIGERIVRAATEVGATLSDAR